MGWMATFALKPSNIVCEKTARSWRPVIHANDVPGRREETVNLDRMIVIAAAGITISFLALLVLLLYYAVCGSGPCG